MESWELFLSLWPYLVAGILLTTAVKIYVSKKRLTDLFSKNRQISIIFAALIGVVSPLGSYIIIPLSAALFTLGLPLPVLMALLMSSPLINPNLFMLTSGAFGLELAFVRTLSSFLLGITAGYVTGFLMQMGWVSHDQILKPSAQHKMMARQEGPKQGMGLFLFELYKMTKYVSKFFFLAIVLAAAVKILVSPNYIVRVFGSNMFLSVLFSTGAGVPFYVCGGAAIPVVQQLAELGMSKGAVLAFFISGPVTKISNLVMMNAAFKHKVFMVYLLVGIIGAFVLGLVYNLI